MRAGRLLRLLLTLQDGRLHTARQLADQLGVSPRTVLRDLDALSTAGIPVYAVRGPQGGFQLLDTFRRMVPTLSPAPTPARGKLRRVRVRLSPAALQLALVNGKPEGWRRRPNTSTSSDVSGWIEGSFRFDSYDTALRELLALGPDIEILVPTELRTAMATVGRSIARRHRPLADAT